jgi:hypothetical protein
LPIDLSELETTFDTAFDETSHYLDLETGMVVTIMHETRQYLALYDIEPAGDPDEDPRRSDALSE